MQSKFIINTAKNSVITFLFLMSFSFALYLSGCSSSDEEEVTDKRETDSVEVYSLLQKSFGTYKKALSFNEDSDSKNASESFESSLKYLHKINSKILNDAGNYRWKQDYDELAKSIVQDYLATQSEIKNGSLVFDFADKYSVQYQKVEEVSGDREPLPDGSDIPLERNSAVDGYIDFFSNTDRGKSFIDKTLYRSGKYFPLMRKILRFNNAPEELIYLSVQESGLTPSIVSRAGAVGLWQFMPATGYAYGLGQDEYRDDRMDIEKSTDAAARHLKDLYRTFGDWYLAFAAYNAGPGRVNKAIKKSGSRDFWTLRSFLPGETKNYVPSILALSFVFRNPEEFGFRDVEYGKQLSFDRVNVNAQMTLQQIADLCETDIETIRELNSELTQDMVPDYEDFYQIRIPHKSYKKFLANYDKSTVIDKSRSKEPEFAGDEEGGYEGNIKLAYYKIKDYDPGDPRSIASKDGRKKISYIFKEKDALEAIAVYYAVRPVEIRLWNNISYGTPLKYRQNLDIYLTDEKYKLLFGLSNLKGADVKNKNPDTKKTIEPVSGITSSEISNDEKKVSPEETVKEKPVETNPHDKEKDSFLNANNPENIPVTENMDVNSAEDNVLNETDDNSGDSNSDISNSNNDTGSDNTSPDYTETKTESVNPPVEKKTAEKKTTSTNTKGKVTYYTVQAGDNLTAIADDYGVTAADIIEWNALESDKILVGQKLKLQGTSSDKVKTSIHTVSSGENLTMIADKYGMSLEELKDLNDLDKDVIFAGQKLKVTGGSTKSTTTNSGRKSTYTVKKGETLASIASDNDVTVSDLMKWNNLKNDKILIGQVLKLTGDSPKKKKKK
ncbi:MAG: LysM peptidoglycan-binding domain-containing protein [Bacteroidetes bacterium]|nr:LysM peptidoglycan-binding domain-containing protein [Bacteroidota bacterium]